LEEAVGEACESASARQVARRFGLAESTVRAIDLRYLERWAAKRHRPALRQMGVDEIQMGKKQKFLTVVCNLETAEPLWFGRERRQETLYEFFRDELSGRQRCGIEAVCVDMWEPYRLSIEQWAPQCKIIIRKGGRLRELVKGKRWLLLSRWVNLTPGQRRELNQLLALKSVQSLPPQREFGPAVDVPLRGSDAELPEGWIDQLRWQRLEPFQKLAMMLLGHLARGILNHCRTEVPLGFAPTWPALETPRLPDQAIAWAIERQLCSQRRHRSAHFRIVSSPLPS
jgi:hypothetical protein